MIYARRVAGLAAVTLFCCLGCDRPSASSASRPLHFVDTTANRSFREFVDLRRQRLIETLRDVGFTPERPDSAPRIRIHVYEATAEDVRTGYASASLDIEAEYPVAGTAMPRLLSLEFERPGRDSTWKLITRNGYLCTPLDERAGDDCGLAPEVHTRIKALSPAYVDWLASGR